jgi:hypothetical protein
VKLQYNEQVTSSIALMKINNHLAPIDSYTVSPPSSSFLSFHNLFEVITLTMNRDIGESYQESINQSLFSRMVQLNNNYYAPLVKSIKSSSITSSIHQVGVMVSIVLSMLLECYDTYTDGHDVDDDNDNDNDKDKENDCDDDNDDDDDSDNDSDDDYDSDKENDCNVVVDDDFDYECNDVDDFDDDGEVIDDSDYNYYDDDSDDYDSDKENDCNFVIDDDYDYECNYVDDFDDDINMISYADNIYK